MPMRTDPRVPDEAAFPTRAKYLVHAVLLLALAGGMGAAQAQIPGGLGGLASGALPNLSGMGAGNAAGVLSFCMKNKFLGGGGDAGSVLGSLTKKPGVETSTDYKSGLAGQILPGKGGSPVSVNSLPGSMKSQACNMVLKQGKALM